MIEIYDMLSDSIDNCGGALKLANKQEGSKEETKEENDRES